ncbi:hypothetical protein [Pseudonocardia sp. HH130630-07]|uniref:hypothetical protein n=1 Tax=Pseudonocardia sp. HH130630-07 TaxID=1690815 RepID=UPI000814CB16|nr:hypothetical protein [Pseudonocardia sp. HH130630-07]ANY06549.1 hypothetical protein AFB00_09880 [Pseudonocardia sp. HH130630-07]
MAERRRRWIPPAAWWNLPLPAIASSGAWITQVYFSEDLSPTTQFSLVTVGVLASALTVLLPALEIRRERGRIAAAEQVAAAQITAYKVTTNDILIPLSLAVTDVVTATTATGRREGRQSLRQMTVGFAAEYVGPDRSRSCFYDLDDDPATGRRTLRLRAWHGRSRKPRERFDPADPSDAQVFALVDSLDSMLVTDVGQVHQLGWTDVSEYRTFIAVAVAARDVPLGLLTVDSLQAGDLGDEDLDLVRLFAQVLAIGLVAR